ncbi:hypothetical protein O3M35_011745 [Rhynocoris fuscipes]|uniref:Uncharacterized protein n=1 Tax=Rhynocoris fuscipes TaxID=488301 RepID=A0AAW1CIU8_9HEMI
MRCKLPELKSFCFCISLETGSKIYAFIHLIFSVIFLIQSLIHHSDFYLKTIDGTIDYIETTAHMELRDVGLSLQVVLGVFALLGIYEKKSYLLFPWIVFEMTSVFTAILLIISSFAFSYYNSVVKKKTEFRLINPEQIVDETIFIFIYTYISIIYYSLYKKMDRNNHDNHGGISWRKDSSTDP